jgi:hypothetical protein
MPTVIYAKCHLCRVEFIPSVIYAECHLCRVNLCQRSFMLSATYANFNKIGIYAECHCAECHYAEPLYAECRGDYRSFCKVS